MVLMAHAPCAGRTMASQSSCLLRRRARSSEILNNLEHSLVCDGGSFLRSRQQRWTVASTDDVAGVMNDVMKCSNRERSLLLAQ